MSAYIPDGLKFQIHQVDCRRCCYCLTAEANSGILMTFDHIQRRSKDGVTSFENVCLACRTCNEYKSDSTEAEDPLTGEIVSLFNPRTQQWTEHFAWSLDAIKVQACISGYDRIGLELGAALMLVDRTFGQLKLAKGNLRCNRPNDRISI